MYLLSVFTLMAQYYKCFKVCYSSQNGDKKNQSRANVISAALFCVLVISDHMDDIMNDDLKMTTLAHDEKYIKNQIHEGKNSI